MNILLLLFAFLPSNFFAELAPGDRQVYAPPRGIVAYADASWLYQTISLCDPECHDIYMTAGDWIAETPTAPALYLAEIGRLVVESWTDKYGVVGEVWIPMVTR